MKESDTKLNRSLKFFDIYLISLGYIIGAGIFILIGSTTKYAGKYVWISFLIAGLMSILNGLTYCDLSTIFKKSGGEFDYISSTLGEKCAIFVSLLIILISVFTATTVSLALSNHISKFVKINSQIYSYYPMLMGRYIDAAVWKSTAAINYMQVYPGSGNLALSYKLYGTKS